MLVLTFRQNLIKKIRNLLTSEIDDQKGENLQKKDEC